MGSQCFENKFVMDEIKDKVVILLGITGVGKSSFINSITKKKDCKVGDTAKACTEKILQVDVSNDGYNYYFVDTPGLDDAKGDEKNITQLGNIKTSYPRINTFIIALKFDDLRLSNSIKKALIKFMELFPTSQFWDHVIILRTHSIRSKKFEKMKKNIEGKLLEGISDDPELVSFMEANNIHMPSQLKEFFVDSDPDDLDEETLEEFQSIFKELKENHPIYKEVKEEIKEYINEIKENNFTFIHIKTEKHLKFIDFDGKEHEAIENIGDEKYNLNGLKPILSEVKRTQAEKPRGSLCWKNQFDTRYFLVKYYELSGERKRVECELEQRWEYKGEEAEKDGEKRRQHFYDIHCKTCCSC